MVSACAYSLLHARRDYTLSGAQVQGAYTSVTRALNVAWSGIVWALTPQAVSASAQSAASVQSTRAPGARDSQSTALAQQSTAGQQGLVGAAANPRAAVAAVGGTLLPTAAATRATADAGPQPQVTVAPAPTQYQVSASQLQSAAGLAPQAAIPAGGITVTTSTPVIVNNQISTGQQAPAGGGSGVLGAVVQAAATRPKVVIVPVFLG